MQYNESIYNGDSYNLTNYNQTLVETITPTDADITKSINAIRTESQGTADVIGGSASLQAFLETVTIYQRANTPFAYNNGMYNQYMYNARLDEDEILLATTKALTNLITLTDFIGPFEINQSLFDTVTQADIFTVMADLVFFDLLFTEANVNVQFSNKAISATLRLADWLSIERTPHVDGWGD